MNSKFDVDRKVWKGIEIPFTFPWDMHLSEIVFDALSRTPKRVIQICDDDDTEMTCEQLQLKIIRVAQHLKMVGIGEGDVVGFVCSNSMDLTAFVHGVIQVGAIVNPMYVEHSAADLAHMFALTKPKLVLCDFNVYEKVKDALNSIGSDSLVYATLEEIEGVPNADNFLSATGQEDEYKVEKFADPSTRSVAILSSSGTTGPAKGVSMTQTFFLKLVSMFTSESRSLNFSPISWGSGFSSMITTTITNETRIVTKKPFTPETFFDISTRHKVTNWLGNPILLLLLFQSPLFEKVDKSHVRTVMALGGIINEQMRKTFLDAFPGKHFLIFYGLTEVSVAMTFPGYPIDGLTVGFVLPNHEVKVVDDEGEALGIGEIGEICAKFNLLPFSVSKFARFPCDWLNLRYFQGYYNNPEASATAIYADGFIKTGDVGYVNENGFMYVIDRKKDIFKCKGYHTNPSEIENVIQLIEGVEVVVVVGVPDPLTLFLPAAVIKKKNGFDELKEDDVVAFVAARLPEYKQLDAGVYFVDEFPTTVSGKIIKRDVAKIATKRYNDKHTAAL